jgi:probable F420-dependent oxidoreductase
MRPRLGVNLLASDPSGWLDDCRRIEALGFDEISVADHLVDGSKSPLVALAAAAAVTERVTLSTMVLNNGLRHPAELASEAALLQSIADGRFTLGMGSGYAAGEHDAIGLPLPPVAERLDRLEEAVAALRDLLRGEAVTTRGRHYRLSDHRVWPVPTTPVPILVGGGSHRLLEIAARHADVVGFTGFSVRRSGPSLTHFSAAGLDQRWEHVRAMAGDRASHLRGQALVQQVTISDDREAAAASLVEQWAGEGAATSVDEVLDCPFLLLGTPSEIAAQLHDGTARWGIETWTTFSGRPDDPPLDAAAEIAAELARAPAR